MIKVFISYARENSDIALRVYNDLKKPRIAPWLDTSDIEPGAIWRQEIRDKIDESTYFLALVSEVATSKKFVQQEWSWALEKGKQVIPILIQQFKIPENFALAEFQWIDIEPKYESAMQKILRLLHKSAKQERFAETFSSFGPDNEGWNLEDWSLSDINHTGPGSNSIYGEAKANFGETKKTVSILIDVGDSTSLAYFRKYELSGANMMAQVVFKATLEDEQEVIIEEKIQSFGTADSDWTRKTIDVSRYCGKSVIFQVTVSAKDPLSVMSYAKAWLDDIFLS